MPATPRSFQQRRDPKYFQAQFGGTCTACGTGFSTGDMIGFNTSNELVAEDCCGNQAIHVPIRDGQVVDAIVDAAESTGSDFDSFNRGRSPGIAVIPPGRTVTDKCRRCFLIHTIAQGDECE